MATLSTVKQCLASLQLASVGEQPVAVSLSAVTELFRLLNDPSALPFFYDASVQQSTLALLKCVGLRMCSPSEDWRAVYLLRRCADRLISYDVSLKYRQRGVLDESDSLALLLKPYADPGHTAAIHPPNEYWPPKGNKKGGDGGRETLVVVPGCLSTLLLVKEAIAFLRQKPWLDNKAAVQRLAEWTYERMGGDASRVMAGERRNLHISNLGKGMHSCVNIADVQIGVCRHRALLFKLIFDHIIAKQIGLLKGVRCRLVRGTVDQCASSLAWHAWNVVIIPEQGADGMERSMYYVVDVMRSAQRLYLEGSPEIAMYTGQGGSNYWGSIVADRRLGVSSLNQVVRLDRLGAGGFGEVYKVKLRAPGAATGQKFFALKQVPERMVSQYGLAYVANEAALLLAIDHPHVMRIYSSFYDKDFYMILELGETTFESYFRAGRHDGLRRQELLRFGLELAAGMECLHFTHSVVHSDLKPENLLRTANGTLLIADLGTGHNFKMHGMQSMFAPAAGTRMYMAPEIRDAFALFGNNNAELSGRPRDVWSFGVCLLEGLLTPTYKLSYVSITEANGFWPAVRTEFDEAARKASFIARMIRKCLVVKKEGRPSFTDIRRDFEKALLQGDARPRGPAAMAPDGDRSPSPIRGRSRVKVAKTPDAGGSGGRASSAKRGRNGIKSPGHSALSPMGTRQDDDDGLLSPEPRPGHTPAHGQPDSQPQVYGTKHTVELGVALLLTCFAAKRDELTDMVWSRARLVLIAAVGSCASRAGAVLQQSSMSSREKALFVLLALLAAGIVGDVAHDLQDGVNGPEVVAALIVLAFLAVERERVQVLACRFRALAQGGAGHMEVLRVVTAMRVILVHYASAAGSVLAWFTWCKGMWEEKEGAALAIFSVAGVLIGSMAVMRLRWTGDNLMTRTLAAAAAVAVDQYLLQV